MATSKQSQRDLSDEHPDEYPNTQRITPPKTLNVTIPNVSLPNIIPQFGALICQFIALVLKTIEFVFELGCLSLRIVETAINWLSTIANKGSKYLTEIAHKLH